MDTLFGVLPPPVLPGSLWGSQAPRDNVPSCRVDPPVSMKFPSQSYDHSPKESPCAECGGAPTSTRSGSPCGRPVDQPTIEGEACLTSYPNPPRTALCCAGTCPANPKAYHVSGGPTVATVPGNPCGSSVPDNDPVLAQVLPRLNCDDSEAAPPVGGLTVADLPSMTSGVPRQCPPLSDSNDLSARSSRPPGTLPIAHVLSTDYPARCVFNGPPETTPHVCPAHPGNILHDVSGGYTPIAELDCPCDGSVKRDGSVSTSLLNLPSNFLEFAPSSDILPHQVDDYPPVAEASTFPFHPSRLDTPPPPHQPATAAPESTEVKAASKHQGSARLYIVETPMFEHP